jgi:hypothetical protein
MLVCFLQAMPAASRDILADPPSSEGVFTMIDQNKGWDTSYEWKVVTLLGLGFGLVGLDRWIIAPLFPFMAKDLGLDYQALGNIAGVLGLAWGFFAIISGGFPGLPPGR